MHYHLNDCHESQLLPAGLIRGKYMSNLILKYIFWLCILLCATKIRSPPGGQCCGFVARRFPKRGGLVVLSKTESCGLLKRTTFQASVGFRDGTIFIPDYFIIQSIKIV